MYTFPLRFFSLEYNSISHNLHGVAKDLNGMNAFYYLCEITVAYTLVNEVRTDLPWRIGFLKFEQSLASKQSTGFNAAVGD